MGWTKKIIICLTALQINSKICNSLCKRDYDGGYAKGAECFCYLNKGLIEDFEKDQIKVMRGPFKNDEEPKKVVEW